MLRLGVFVLVAAFAVAQADLLDLAKSVNDARALFSSKDFGVDKLFAKEESDLTKNINLVKGLFSLVKTKASAFKDKADEETKQVIDNIPKIQEKVDDYDKKIYQDSKKTLKEKIESWTSTVKEVFDQDKLILVVKLLQNGIPGINGAQSISCSIALLLLPVLQLMH